MKKIISTIVVTSFLVVGLGLIAHAEMAKEDSTSGKTYFTGTLKSLPMGKDYVQINYEVFGVSTADAGKGLFHNASAHFAGAIHSVKGEYEESGMGVLILPDGDKVFMTIKGSGQLEKSGKGTLTYVGGTGKYSGIQGSGEWTRYQLRPPAEGMSTSFTVWKSNWKLPEAKK
jgi:hypothetical protein